MKKLISIIVTLAASTALAKSPDWQLIVNTSKGSAEINTIKVLYEKDGEGDPSYGTFVRLTLPNNQTEIHLLLIKVKYCAQKAGTLWMMNQDQQAVANPAIYDRQFTFVNKPANLYDMVGLATCQLGQAKYNK